MNRRLKAKTKATPAIDELIRSLVARDIDLNDVEIVLTFEGGDANRIKLKVLLRQDDALSTINTSSLTPLNGIQKIREQVKERHSSTRVGPQWNGRELVINGKIVKRFRNPGPNQSMVLDHFQLEGWPQRIDNPLSATGTIDAQSRLADTIKSLNRCQKNCLIRFHGDGTGNGVSWRFCPEAENAS